MTTSGKWSLLHAHTDVDPNTPGTIPLGRSSTAIALVDPNTLLIWSGENQPRRPIDSRVHLFDLQTRKFGVIETSSDVSVPRARVGHTGVVAQGKYYIYGGRVGAGHEQESLDDFWHYDPKQTQWTQIKDASGSSPGLLSYHASTVSSDGNLIYVFGGCPTSGRSNQLYSYNIELNTWEHVTSSVGNDNTQPNVRGGATIVSVPNSNDLYVLFGFNGKTELNDVWKWHSAEKKWTEVLTSGEVPLPRSVTDVVYLDSLKSLFVFGGEGSPSSQGHEGAGKYHQDAFLLDLNTLAWRQVKPEGDVPAARGWFNTVSANGNSAIIFGGFDGNVRRNDVWQWQQ